MQSVVVLLLLFCSAPDEIYYTQPSFCSALFVAYFVCVRVRACVRACRKRQQVTSHVTLASLLSCLLLQSSTEGLRLRSL